MSDMTLKKAFPVVAFNITQTLIESLNLLGDLMYELPDN